jgi:hypothetical protein
MYGLQNPSVHPTDRASVSAQILTQCFSIFLYSNFNNTLTAPYLEQIQIMLVCDGVIAPLVLWLQPVIYLKRVLIAPVEDNIVRQEGYFGGHHTCLGAQLAHRTSSLFIGFFFVALLPLGVAVTCLAFVIAYWVSKHGILRRWLRLPCYGTALMPLLNLFTYLAIGGCLVMSMQFYAGWPFDHVCFEDGDASRGNGWHCNKRPVEWIFLAPKSWQTPVQRELLSSYKYCTAIFMVCLIVWFIGVASVYSVRVMFFGYTSGVGDDQGVPYTTVDEIQAYIPFFQHQYLEMPLIACDRTKFDDEYIHFQGKYDIYDLFDTVVKKHARAHEKVNMETLFSTCTFFPTVDNPDPLKKIDEGDSSLGKLWVYIEEATGIKHASRFDAHQLSVKCRFKQCVWCTDERPANDAQWDEEFLVLVTDFDAPLKFALRDDSYGLYNTLGFLTVDLGDIHARYPKGGEWTVSEEMTVKAHPGRFQRRLLKKGGKLTVRFVWEPDGADVENTGSLAAKMGKSHHDLAAAMMVDALHAEIDADHVALEKSPMEGSVEGSVPADETNAEVVAADVVDHPEIPVLSGMPVNAAQHGAVKGAMARANQAQETTEASIRVTHIPIAGGADDASDGEPRALPIGVASQQVVVRGAYRVQGIHNTTPASTVTNSNTKFWC